MAPHTKLLVTGVTGYIGFQTLLIALDRGRSVRAVVRRQEDVESLRVKSPLIVSSHDEGRLAFAVVPDFLRQGAIAEHLDGITAIIHLASPLATQTEDYDGDIVAPAVNTVLSVLHAAAQAPSVKRAVITSSCVTLVPYEWNFAPDSTTTYTADSINSDPKQPHTSPMQAYWASKALARTAARDFFSPSSDQKPSFDFVHLLPSVVIGPDARLSAERGDRPEDLATGTRASVLASALDPSLNSPFPFVGTPIHVRDVATAHVDAAVNVEGKIPGNAEYVLSSDSPEGIVWDRDTRAVAEKYFADEVEAGVLPLAGSLGTVGWRLDGGPAKGVFGWGMMPFEGTMREMLGQYLELKRGEASK